MNTLNNGQLSIPTTVVPIGTSQQYMGSTIYNAGNFNAGGPQPNYSVLNNGLLGNSVSSNMGVLVAGNTLNNVLNTGGSAVGSLIQPVVGTGIIAGNAVGNAVYNLGYASNLPSNAVGGVVGNTVGNNLATVGTIINAVGITGGNAVGSIDNNYVGGAVGYGVNTANHVVGYAVDASGNVLGTVSNTGSLLNVGNTLLGTGTGSTTGTTVASNAASGGILNNGGLGIINLSNANVAPSVNLLGTQAVYQSNTNNLSQQEYSTQINNPVSTTYSFDHAV